ncbi:unnamed protein product [Moneuplotes crassus]|uniref:Uncharacterized protein n=1 Tax=Euplotes crassus TaxID=5936 RepID=A0AAD1XQT4_EUPCR|nr:unnamed protein product [Moneuplotes crassus]
MEKQKKDKKKDHNTKPPMRTKKVPNAKSRTSKLIMKSKIKDLRKNKAQKLNPFNERDVPDNSNNLLDLDDNSDLEEYLEGSYTQKHGHKTRHKESNFCEDIKETEEDPSLFDTSMIAGTRIDPNNGAAAVSKLGQTIIRSPKNKLKRFESRLQEENKQYEESKQDNAYLNSDLKQKHNILARSKNADVSPIMAGEGKKRKISVMDEMFNTSGIFSKRTIRQYRKKSKFWGPDELIELMGSVAKNKD